MHLLLGLHLDYNIPLAQDMAFSCLVAFGCLGYIRT